MMHGDETTEALSRTDTRLRPSVLCAFMLARLAEVEIAALEGPRVDRLLADLRARLQNMPTPSGE